MYMPAYIAEEKGYFKQRDLESKIVTFSRSNDINALRLGRHSVRSDLSG